MESWQIKHRFSDLETTLAALEKRVAELEAVVGEASQGHSGEAAPVEAAQSPRPTTATLDTCPSCGGPADNGHDRCVPPNAYNCSKCSG